MKFSEVVKEIEGHTWWSEEGPGCIQTMIHPLKVFITQSNILHPKYLSISVMGFRDSLFYERTPAEEKYKVHKYVCKRMKKDKNYLKNIQKETLKRSKACFEILHDFAKNRNSMSNEELYTSYVDFYKSYLKYLEYPAGVEFIDVFTDQHLEPMMKKELPHMSQDKLMDTMVILTAPKKLSFMEDERLEFLDICLKNFDTLRKRKTSSKLEKQLKKHSEKFHHVLNNFKDVRYLDTEHFFKSCKEEVRKGKFRLQKEYNSLKNKIKNLKKEKKSLYKKYDFSEDTKINLRVTELAGEHIDSRKTNMMKANYYQELYFEEIAKRFNIDLFEVKNYTYEEMKEFLSSGKKPSKKTFDERYKLCAYVMKKGSKGLETKWYFGKEADILLKKTLSNISKEIKGQVASAPVKKLKGTAQVIMDITKEKFKQGNILVTSMTRPEFVPLMRKAKAIVTDEGGITCHAAILSRELKIPCIIGTKSATRMLKSGDRIEMDMEKGLVKKL